MCECVGVCMCWFCLIVVLFVSLNSVYVSGLLCVVACAVTRRFVECLCVCWVSGALCVRRYCYKCVWPSVHVWLCCWKCLVLWVLVCVMYLCVFWLLLYVCSGGCACTLIQYVWFVLCLCVPKCGIAVARGGFGV